jgi:hypothetical protein
MLTPEPTSGVIWNANRGAVTVRVTVHGREAHVGLLHQGRSAFEDAVRAVARLQRLAQRVGRRRTRFRVTPDAARRSLMLIGGRVEAGSNFKVVPGRCVFTVDRRMNPEEHFETERQRLLDVFDDARRAGISLDVDVVQEGRPSGRRKPRRSVRRSAPTCARSPAKCRHSRCVQVSWRSGSTPHKGCRRTPTALAFLPCPTVPRNSFTPIALLNARPSTHARQPPSCSPLDDWAVHGGPSSTAEAQPPINWPHPWGHFNTSLKSDES